MADLMSKTKKELVVLIEELQIQLDQAAKKPAETEVAKHLKELENNYQEVSRANEQLVDEYQALKKTETDLRQNLEDLQEQVNELSRENKDLQEQLTAGDDQVGELNFLLEAFSGSHGQVLLVDQEFTVKYASGQARDYIAASGCPDVMGSSVFDLFGEGEGMMKLKKKFTKALLSGEKEKIKKVRLNGPALAERCIKLKISPVVFNEKPGLILRIKDA